MTRPGGLTAQSALVYLDMGRACHPSGDEIRLLFVDDAYTDRKWQTRREAGAQSKRSHE